MIANNDFCIAILKSVVNANSCRHNLVGDRNRLGEIASWLGLSSMSSDQRHEGNIAFDWLKDNDFVRLTNDNPGNDWIEITDKGRMALARGSVRECDIFISHAAIDSRLALKLKAELEKRLSYENANPCSVRCFCSSDPTDLPPGAEWSKQIQDALKSAAVFLLVVSPGSLVRPWVWFEVGAVWFSTHIKIVPLCFGGQELSKLPPPWNVKQGVRGVDFASIAMLCSTALRCKVDENGTQAVGEDLIRIDADLAIDRKEAIVVLPILQPNQHVTVFPDRPTEAQEGGFTVQELHADWVKLAKASNRETISLPRTAIERVERTGDKAPSRVVLKGRLQWLTLKRVWEHFPESPIDGFGVPYVVHQGLLSNPDIDKLISQARSFGVEVGWANLDRCHTQHGKQGEVVYFNDGRYVRSAQGQILVRVLR